MCTSNFSESQVQIFVEKFLSSEERQGISQSISNAYSAVDGIYKATPALGAFGMIGLDLRPHLLRVFVEHSLKKYADQQENFTHEIKPNTARNCSHLRLYKNGLALTAHYMGAKCERSKGRKALHKCNLSERNGNLFDYENNEQDIFKNIGYAEIMHGGFFKPTNIIINIPSRDQNYSVGAMSIAVVCENKTEVEEIIEETPFKLNEAIEELKNGIKKAS